MTPPRFTQVATSRHGQLWRLQCACGTVTAYGASLDEVRFRLIAEHARLIPLCLHRELPGWREAGAA